MILVGNCELYRTLYGEYYETTAVELEGGIGLTHPTFRNPRCRIIKDCRDQASAVELVDALIAST